MGKVFWIEGPGPGRIGVMPRPYGGEDLDADLRDFRRREVDVVVSCLEPDEAARYGLEREGERCAALGLEYLSFPIPDHTAPADLAGATSFAAELARRYRAGKGIAVHCLAGIGRSPTIAGATLLELGMSLDDILQRMRAARGYPVPEMPEQLAWLRRLTK